jgi:hypothetical protein
MSTHALLLPLSPGRREPVLRLDFWSSLTELFCRGTHRVCGIHDQLGRQQAVRQEAADALDAAGRTVTVTDAASRDRSNIGSAKAGRGVAVPDCRASDKLVPVLCVSLTFTYN